MKWKHRKLIILSLIIVALSGWIGYEVKPVLSADKTWIVDFGYDKNEIHKLSFNRRGVRSCPEIPVKIGNSDYEMGFDTGCGVGLFFTNVMEDKMDYQLMERIEELNRDGTHRGWGKRIQIDRITVYGREYKHINTSISDWNLYSSQKFNGTIGLAFFQSRIITLDYKGHKIAIGNRPIDYSKISAQYIVLPLYKSSGKNQENLPFFEAEYNGKPIMVYLDTGKNYSYVNASKAIYSMADKPTKLVDIPLKIGSMEIILSDVAEVNNLAQADGLPYPTGIELNSDQIWKCNLLVTFDLIEHKIIFAKFQ